MRISYEAHRGIEFVIGLAVGGIPLGLTAAQEITPSPAAILLTSVYGALLTTMGVASTRDGPALNVAAHALVDRILAALGFVGAVSLGLSDERTAAAICLAAAVAVALVSLQTSYVSDAREEKTSAF